MFKFGLGTFMKIASADANQKIKLYEDKLKAGGFSYYRELYAAIEVATLRGKDILEAGALLANIGDLHRRKNLSEAFEAFKELYLEKGFKFYRPSAQELISPGGFMQINVRPIALIDGDHGKELVYAWPMKKPQLQQRVAGIGIDVLTRCYSGNSIQMFAIADLRAKVIHRASSTSRMAAALTAGELAFGDSFLQAEIKKAA